jgi:alkylation response protein AidB-like acyl-CoA dehydrogenase
MFDDSGPPSDHERQMQALADLHARLRAMERTVNQIHYAAYFSAAVLALCAAKLWL